MGDAEGGELVDFWRRAVGLADKHRWKIAFVVLRESDIESRSIWVASLEHRWSIHGACREHIGGVWGHEMGGKGKPLRLTSQGLTHIPE